MAASRWLLCEVRNGVFRDERTIRIALAPGGTLDAFVPASDVVVEAGGGRGRVKVSLVSVSDGCWVLLPAENPNLVPVREGDLVA